MRTTAVVLSIVLAATIMALAVGLRIGSVAGYTNRIHYVLPDGFRGEFRVIPDDSTAEDFPVVGGRAVADIPPDGVLRVRDKGPLHGWHVRTAAFVDGRTIPYDPDLMSDQTVAIRGSGADSRGFFYYFVGTAEEYRAWAKSLPR